MIHRHGVLQNTSSTHSRFNWSFGFYRPEYYIPASSADNSGINYMAIPNIHFFTEIHKKLSGDPLSSVLTAYYNNKINLAIPNSNKPSLLDPADNWTRITSITDGFKIENVTSSFNNYTNGHERRCMFSCF